MIAWITMVPPLVSPSHEVIQPSPFPKRSKSKQLDVREAPCHANPPRKYQQILEGFKPSAILLGILGILAACAELTHWHSILVSRSFAFSSPRYLPTPSLTISLHRNQRIIDPSHHPLSSHPSNRSTMRLKKMTQSSMRCAGLSKMPISSRSCLVGICNSHITWRLI